MQSQLVGSFFTFFPKSFLSCLFFSTTLYSLYDSTICTSAIWAFGALWSLNDTWCLRPIPRPIGSPAWSHLLTPSFLYCYKASFSFKYQSKCRKGEESLVAGWWNVRDYDDALCFVSILAWSSGCTKSRGLKDEWELTLDY
jgi:hypothetical protein